MINIGEYRKLVDTFHDLIVNVPEDTAGIRLAEDKWSLKEIVGHLIDSASNNHQRFVRLQFGDLLDFPPYDGEKWVMVQKYGKMDWGRLISLWYSYNSILISIIEHIDSSKYPNVWVKGETAIPLDELIVDYYRHLRMHVEHFGNRLKEVEGK